jgi:hypothetical protein
MKKKITDFSIRLLSQREIFDRNRRSEYFWNLTVDELQMSSSEASVDGTVLRNCQTMRTSLWSELRRTWRSYKDMPQKRGSLNWIECAPQKAGKILSG